MKAQCVQQQFIQEKLEEKREADMTRHGERKNDDDPADDDRDTEYKPDYQLLRIMSPLLSVHFLLCQYSF